MNIFEIIKAIQAKRVNITYHAREEAKNDSLLLDEIFFSTRQGELLKIIQPTNLIQAVWFMADHVKAIQFIVFGRTIRKARLLC